MLTLKPLHRTLIVSPRRISQNPKRMVQGIAIAALLALLFPSLSAFISHQIRTEAAGGTSCLRVSADRKSQVRKYGADCNP